MCNRITCGDLENYGNMDSTTDLFIELETVRKEHGHLVKGFKDCTHVQPDMRTARTQRGDLIQERHLT